MRHPTSSEIRQLSPQEIEQYIAHTYQQLTNVQLANHIQRGLLRPDHPDYQDGLEYALNEARGRVAPEVRAAEIAALVEASRAAAPGDDWQAGGAHFLIEGLRAL